MIVALLYWQKITISDVQFSNCFLFFPQRYIVLRYNRILSIKFNFECTRLENRFIRSKLCSTIQISDNRLFSNNSFLYYSICFRKMCFFTFKTIVQSEFCKLQFRYRDDRITSKVNSMGNIWLHYPFSVSKYTIPIEKTFLFFYFSKLAHYINNIHFVIRIFLSFPVGSISV